MTIGAAMICRKRRRSRWSRPSRKRGTSRSTSAAKSGLSASASSLFQKFRAEPLIAAHSSMPHSSVTDPAIGEYGGRPDLVGDHQRFGRGGVGGAPPAHVEDLIA